MFIRIEPRTEAEFLTMIRQAFPPPGRVNLERALGLLLGWFGLTLLFCAAWLFGVFTETQLPMPILAGLYVALSLGVCVMGFRQASRNQTALISLTALQTQRAHDPRLARAGSMCDAVALRRPDDRDTAERLHTIEARLHALVRDELRVSESMDGRDPETTQNEAAAKDSLTAEIDRLLAGISSLHASVVSPNAATGALDWLEAEAELAEPARLRAPVRRSQ